MSMKKFVSMAIALVLLVSMAAGAVAAPVVNQVTTSGATWYYDQEGGKVSASSLGQNGSVVELSKTVAATDVENEFEVTLQVKTTEDLREIRTDSPDAAVMLIMDVSNSMGDCAECGREENHACHSDGETYQVKDACPNGSGDSYQDGRDIGSRCDLCGNAESEHTDQFFTTCDYESRLAQAKTAAKDFLDDFATKTGAEAGDKRMVALVDFGSLAATRLTWVDVNAAGGLTRAKNAVDGLTVAHADTEWEYGAKRVNGNWVYTGDSGGTNIEAALMLGANLWTQGRGANGAVKDIDYMYTILLTDGNPTYHVEGTYYSDYEEINGKQGGGRSTTFEDARHVGREADRILNLGAQAKLYSICFGTDSNGTPIWNTKPFKTWSDAEPKTTESMTVGEWLEAFSSDAYNGTATGLFDSFDTISAQIQLLAKAWRVTDQMGDYIVYGGEIKQANVNNVVSVNGDSLEWVVINSAPVNVVTTNLPGGGVRTELTYALKYKVTLDNLNAAYSQGAIADTNASAKLTYAVKQNDGSYELVDPVEFPVPAVKGLLGSFRFRKVQMISGQPVAMPGITFVLDPAEKALENGVTTISPLTATSDADGWVTFNNIPSGHTYHLIEDVMQGYADFGEIDVDVDWGTATPDRTKMQTITNGSTQSYQLVNTALDAAVGLNLSKTFESQNAPRPGYVTFRVTGPNNFVQNVTLNARNGWNHSFKYLTPGRYTITETSEFPGYNQTTTATLHANTTTSNLTVTNNSVTVDLTLQGSSYFEYDVNFKNVYRQKVGNVTLNKAFWAPSEEDLLKGVANPASVQLASALYQNVKVEIDLINKDGQVTRTVSLPQSGSWTATVTGLPIGEYTLNERIISGTIPGYTFERVLFSPTSVEVGENATATVNISNMYNRDLGQIRLEKAFAGDILEGSELLAEKIISVNVYGSNAAGEIDRNNLVTTLHLSAAGEWHAQTRLLPVGDYWLEEVTAADATGTADIPNYDITPSFVTAKVTVSKSTTVPVNLTNTYEAKMGTLQVTKAFHVDSALKEESAEIKDKRIDVLVLDSNNQIVAQLKLNDGGSGWTQTVELPVGDYTLLEITGENVETEYAEYDYKSAFVKDYAVTSSWDNNTAAITITENNTATAPLLKTVTNKYVEDMGHLTITKVFSGLSDEEKEEILANLELRVNILEVDESNGTTTQVQSVLLDKASGWTRTISLPVGQYMLEEVQPDLTQWNYTAVGVTVNNEKIDEHKIELSKGATVPAVITNTYKKDTGSITVKKVFGEDSVLTADDFKDKDIAVRILDADGRSVTQEDLLLSSKNNWTAEVNDLPVAAYTLVEARQPGTENTAYVQDYTLDVKWEHRETDEADAEMVPGAVVHLTKGAKAEAQVTNTYSHDMGILSVRKFFDGIKSEHVAELRNLNITVQVRSTKNPNDVQTMTITPGTWLGHLTLPVGVYEISEPNITMDGYVHTGKLYATPGNEPITPSIDGWAKVTVTKNTDYVVHLTNTFDENVAPATFVKQISGVDVADEPLLSRMNIVIYAVNTATQERIPVTLSAKENWTFTLESLPVGSYTFEEDLTTAELPGYGQPQVSINPAAVDVVLGVPVTVTIINQYTKQSGTIAVKKLFSGELMETDFAERQINVDVKNSAGQTVTTLELNKQNNWLAMTGQLPVGQYTLSEQNAEVEGYTLNTKVEGQQVVNGVISVSPLLQSTVYLSNDYTANPGALTITKVLTGDQSRYPASVQFVLTGANVNKTVTLTAADQWTTTVTGLPAGEYTVTEVIGQDAVTTTWSLPEGKVTIAPGQNASITCTNDYDARKVIRIPVQKTVTMTGNITPGAETFSFGLNVNAPEGVTVRMETDAASTAGGVVKTSATGYNISLSGAGTVKGYIVLEGYANQLKGVTVETWEKLTGYSDAKAAEADGWVYDETATRNIKWTIALRDDSAGDLTQTILCNGKSADQVSFVNTYTKTEAIVPPPTGDDSNMTLWLGMLLLGVLGLLTAKRLRKAN